MNKSLGTILVVAAVGTTILLKIVTKSWIGPALVLGLTALYFGVTVLSEFLKLNGKKVQGRDRHP